MNNIELPEDEGPSIIDAAFVEAFDLAIDEVEKEAKSQEGMGFKHEALAIRRVIARIERLKNP